MSGSVRIERIRTTTAAALPGRYERAQGRRGYVHPARDEAVWATTWNVAESWSPTARARFERYVRFCAAHGAHPDVVDTFPALLDHWRVGRRRGRVQRFINGVPLVMRHEANVHARAPTPAVAIWRALRLARALAVAHRFDESVTHGRIGPSRILIGADAAPVLLGLGTARTFNDEPHTAPEAWSERADDALTDVFGVAAVLVDELTGRAPFEPRNTAGKRLFTLEQLPLPVRALVDAALARSRSARPRDCAELADALGHALASLGSASADDVAAAAGALDGAGALDAIARSSLDAQAIESAIEEAPLGEAVRAGHAVERAELFVARSGRHRAHMRDIVTDATVPWPRRLRALQLLVTVDDPRRGAATMAALHSSSRMLARAAWDSLGAGRTLFVMRATASGVELAADQSWSHYEDDDDLPPLQKRRVADGADDDDDVSVALAWTALQRRAPGLALFREQGGRTVPLRLPDGTSYALAEGAMLQIHAHGSAPIVVAGLEKGAMWNVTLEEGGLVVDVRGTRHMIELTPGARLVAAPLVFSVDDAGALSLGAVDDRLIKLAERR